LVLKYYLGDVKVEEKKERTKETESRDNEPLVGRVSLEELLEEMRL